MAEFRENFFSLTGGPGSGKSTLLAALKARDFAVVPETGRRIIQTQFAIGGNVLPSVNPMAYAQMELGVGLINYCETDPQRTTIFDRGILDPLGFLTVIGHDIPNFMWEATRQFRYNQTVFLAPPWIEIYARDTERTQDFAEACATYDAMVTVYDEAGYDLVELPQTNVDDRAEFVLDTLLRRQYAIA